MKYNRNIRCFITPEPAVFTAAFPQICIAERPSAGQRHLVHASDDQRAQPAEGDNLHIDTSNSGN